MVMEVNYIPGRWMDDVTATGARQPVAFEGGKHVAEAKRSYYRERYDTAERAGWGAKAPPPVGVSGPSTFELVGGRATAHGEKNALKRT